MRRRLHSATVGLALVASLIGCGRGRPAPQVDPLMDVFRTQAQEEGLTRTETEGKRLFGHYCVTCHGEIGAGDGQNAYNLDPKPPSFSTPLATHPSSYWRQLIEGGSAAVGRSPLCPPWGRTLTSSEIDALMAYLDVLREPRSAAAPPKEPIQHR